MKNIIISFALLTLIQTSLQAQKISRREEIKETEVPKAVNDAHNSNIGLPADKWIVLTIDNLPRYVAVVQQMNQSSGKTLQHRYRYNENGKATSNSEYRGNGKNEEKDFFVVYLGTGNDNSSFQNKIAKLLKENSLISFEGFGFTPGNQPDQYITTHRFVLKNKTGGKSILYFDTEGNEVDIAKYPIRRSEADEADSQQ